MTILVSIVLLSASVFAGRPLAPHVTAFVAPNGEVLIRLPTSDPDTGARLRARIRSLPALGTLHYVSSLFDTYGYEPKRGDVLREDELTLLLESKDNAIVYVPPTESVRSPSGMWSTFTYSLSDGLFESNEATVWVTPNHGRIAFSDFDATSENWTVANNGNSIGADSV